MEKRFRLGPLAFIGLLRCAFHMCFFSACCEGSLESQYVGCFIDTSSAANWTVLVLNSDNMTIEYCVQTCKVNNTTYAILQEGRNCLCGDVINASYPINNCAMPCSGNQNEVCGGSEETLTSSVIFTACPVGYYGAGCDQVCHCKHHIPCYRFSGMCPNGCENSWTGDTCSQEVNVTNRYIGCYGDNPSDAPNTRAIGARIYDGNENTIEFCSKTCSLLNNTYVGLQYYTQCFCGESYNMYGTVTNCNTQCTGNQAQICGGVNAISVYSVCPTGSYGSDCIAQCNCQNSNICRYATGLCDSGCKPGWSGGSCSNRDCSNNNGACSTNESCVSINLKFSNVTRCQCSPGFQRTRLWDNCTDINECNLGLCDSQTTTCSNTVGSFVCTCINGFTIGNKTLICEDIDECTQNPGICNSSVEDCKNTLGSYTCGCKKGYKYDNSGMCIDIDECLSSPCDDSTNCSNTPGSFRCDCKSGFTRINNTDSFCTDINECLSSPCTDNSTDCANTRGSYRCECKSGFTRNNSDTVCRPTAVSGGDGNGRIIGAVVGTVLGLALVAVIVLLALYLYRRRRPKKLENPYNEIKELSRPPPGLRQDRVISLYGNDSTENDETGSKSGNALNTLRNKLSDPDIVKQEFQSVELQLKDFCALGTMTEVKKKNRFINIIPYESNRVVLSRTSDDDISQYINASYVQGYDNETKYIAAQGPREVSLEDFWRMMIENRVHLIVMITKLVENNKDKCAKYWPELGQPVVYGDVTVTLRSEEDWPDYTARCIQCSKKSETVELKQLHYRSWPDHGVPNDIKSFLTFRRIVRQQMKPDKYTVIHCSAGAGRTGAFIAIDYLLEQEKVEHDVNVFDCLKKLRDQRSHMIQNLAQYEFVHNALLMAFEIGDTVIPTTQFQPKYTKLQTKDPKSGRSTLEKQFQLLEQVKMHPDETAKYRVWSNLVAQDKMDEMNAVYVQSWKLKDAYLVTRPVGPVTNLWELRRELNCSVIINLDPTQGSEKLFFPTKDNPMSLKDYTLLFEGKTHEEYGSRYTVSESKTEAESTYANAGASSDTIYQNTGSSSAKTQITVLHVTDFLGKSTEDAIRLMSLYNVLSSLPLKRNDVPVMVVSSDCSLSGLCLAAFNAFEMMKQEELVDIYQFVLNIRKSRTELFNSMSSYIDLHNVVERYIIASTA